MLIPSDYKSLLRALNKHRVRYLVIGAYAVIYYTEPRYSKDLDIWVEPAKQNAKRIYAALKEFGAPLKGITADDFANEGLVYQIGVEPVRADIMTGFSDIDFARAWKYKKQVFFEDVKIKIIGRRELIEVKLKAGRPIDLIDAESLKLTEKLKKGA